MVAAATVVALLAYVGVSAVTATDADTALEADDRGLSLLAPGTRVLVREVDQELPRADGALYELSKGRATRRVGTLECKRVHAISDGPGLCFALSANGIDYEGIVFDERYRPQARFQVDGVPDRARVSSDGRYGAYTTFDEAGAEGYFASTSEFSTNTSIVDMRSGRELRDMRDVEVTDRGGRPFSPTDAEIWGIDFPGGDRYYATLASDEFRRQGHYLIEGRVQSKHARVIARHVECPSLSPDGGRIAYKRRIGESNRWRLHVRDLASGRDVALAETRSIDDQPEWVGDDLVAYSDDKSTFVVAADGSGEPRRVASSATSPALLAP